MNDLDILNCKNNKCPICESKIEYKRYQYNDFSISCINKCFSYFTVDFSDDTEHYFEVFDEFYKYNTGENTQEYINNINEKIVEKINYWKENDRYLVKIMVG